MDIKDKKVYITDEYIEESLEKRNSTNFYPIVDVHATWLVLNPIQGCPKKCKYCFLRERTKSSTT